MKQRFMAAAVQMISGLDVQANLQAAQKWVTQAANAGAELVVLPEFFFLMGQDGQDKLVYQELYQQGSLQKALSALAKECQIWLVAGTLPLCSPDPQRVFNSTLVYAPDGSISARYDKIHLFSFSGLGERYQESTTILPGHQPTKIKTDLAELALGICYDVRFPELFRSLVPYDILALPAAFTYTTGEAHWEILLRARAIENQSYVIAAAQGGEHANGRKTYGHSMIIDPWGRVLAQKDQGEGYVLAEINQQHIESVRTRLPALANRLLR